MRPGLTTVVSFAPSGAASTGRALAQYGTLSPAVYSWTLPGGCNALSATFARPPRYRTDALDNGRLVRAYRGGAVVWEGILDEAAPGDDGWQITAHGAGAWGNDYQAVWSPPWDATIPDDVVNAAIGRGLDWVNPGIGNPSGMWIGQEMDSATSKVTDVLNMACSKGGLTWIIRTVPRGNVLTVMTLPTAANRLLICTDPVPRSVADAPTRLYVRYQATWDDPDAGTDATYATTYVDNAALDGTGHREDVLDISSAGVYTAADAQAVGVQAFKQFTRIAFTEPFTVRHGGLRNLGGTPVDPGVFYTDNQYGMVCRVLLADYTPGSDSQLGAPVFLVGAYEWNDAEVTATITAAETVRHDFAGLLSMIAESLPVRTQPASKNGK